LKSVKFGGLAAMSSNGPGPNKYINFFIDIRCSPHFVDTGESL
jgi:hypothetical protein